MTSCRTLSIALALAMLAVPMVSAQTTIGSDSIVQMAKEPAKSCSYEDQSWGVGGQGGTCTFTCEDHDAISVSVEADNQDASVSGTGDCGGINVHCTGTGSCSDTQVYSDNGQGTCSGDSDEAVDSGFYMGCSASTTGEPPNPEWCPVTEPTLVCVKPVPPVCDVLPTCSVSVGETVENVTSAPGTAAGLALWAAGVAEGTAWDGYATAMDVAGDAERKVMLYVDDVQGLVYYVVYQVVPGAVDEVEVIAAYVLSTINIYGDEVQQLANYLMYDIVPETQRQAEIAAANVLSTIEFYGDEVGQAADNTYNYVSSTVNNLDPCGTIDCSPDAPNPGDYVNPGDLPGLDDVPDPCDTGVCKFIDVSGVSMTASTPSAEQVSTLLSELAVHIAANPVNGTSVHVYAEGDFAIGASCTGPFACTLLKPTCETNSVTEGLSCTIGGSSKS